MPRSLSHGIIPPPLNLLENTVKVNFVGLYLTTAQNIKIYIVTDNQIIGVWCVAAGQGLLYISGHNGDG